MSSTNKLIDRQYGKFDSVFSYVGGLLGMITSIIGFFILSYNQYRYELSIASNSFVKKSFDNTRVTEDDMNVPRYIKYTVFDWIQVLTCGHQLGWDDCKLLDSARQEGINEVDIRYILRRINHLQNVNKLKMSDEEDLILSLSENPTIEKKMQKRDVTDWVLKIMQGRIALTLEHIEILNKDNSNQKANGSQIQIYFMENIHLDTKVVTEQNLMD